MFPVQTVENRFISDVRGPKPFSWFSTFYKKSLHNSWQNKTIYYVRNYFTLMFQPELSVMSAHSAFKEDTTGQDIITARNSSWGR